MRGKARSSGTELLDRPLYERGFQGVKARKLGGLAPFVAALLAMVAAVSPPGDEPPDALPWHHLWIIRLGPLAMWALGLALIIVSMVTDRSDAIEVAYATLGTVLVTAGILIPRFKGPVEVSTTGVKGEMVPLASLDRRDYASIGPGAAEPARELPEAPVRPSEVTIQDIIDEAQRQGWTLGVMTDKHLILRNANASQQLAVPRDVTWRATHELLQVARAAGLRISDRAPIEPGNLSRLARPDDMQ